MAIARDVFGISMLETVHGKYVFGRRVQVLARELAPLMPDDSRVLDVGCGDGTIACLLGQARPDLHIEGIDVLVRPETKIPVRAFDGAHISHADNSLDVVMFVDVLHHTDDPMVLLREARRVARKAVIIKDHCRDGALANTTLRFMDWVGNARHGVVLSYVYWPERRWRAVFRDVGLKLEVWRANLGLYPWPFSILFDRKLHFVARLTPTS